MDSPSMALWWIKAGEEPSLESAFRQLDHLRDHGPSVDGFGFKDALPAPDLDGTIK